MSSWRCAAGNQLLGMLESWRHGSKDQVGIDDSAVGAGVLERIVDKAPAKERERVIKLQKI